MKESTSPGEALNRGIPRLDTHEPDPQIDGGLPWTRADEDRALAIADYYEEEIE